MNRERMMKGLRAKNVAFDANVSDRQLRALFNQHCRITKTLNYAKGGGAITVAFNDDGGDGTDDPAEIMICDEIGKDPWSNEGFGVKDLRAALDAITPKGRALSFMVNSPGGNVSDGIAIRNLLNEWPGPITNTIIGMAASAASWCIPADETRAYKSSQMFIHRSWGYVVGNADDMRAAIQFLETTDNQIADIYADQTGKPAEEMLDLMSDETLLTGQEACDLGLVDKVIDGDAKNTFTNGQLNAMRQKLAALNSIRTSAHPGQGERTGNKQTRENNGMTKEQKIALLNKRGVTVPANADEAKLDSLISASDSMRAGYKTILDGWNVAIPAEATEAQVAQLVANGKPAAPAGNGTSELQQLRDQVNQLTSANSEANRVRLGSEIDQLVRNDQLTENERAAALARVIKDETYLIELKNRPSMPPGANPVGASAGAEIVGEGLNDIQKYVLKNTDGLQARFVGKNADNYIGQDEHGRLRIRKELAQSAKLAARAVSKLTNPKNREKILAAWNANTIDAGLQRQVIFTDFIEEYAVVLAPFNTFSKVYANVPLEGTDTVEVPFYPLSGAVAKSWNPATGYVNLDGTVLNSRPVVIGGSGTASGAAAPAGTACDRKYVGLQFSSYELRRQPYENWEQHAKLQANALAVAIFSDVISRVVCAANFGASVKAVPAALFSGNDVADLTEVANGVNWPTFGRWLVLDHRYLTPLLKDPTFKQYLSYGSTDPIRMALIKQAYGFENILFVPNLNNYSPGPNTNGQGNAENLFGWINHMFSTLVATAPIMPTEDVLQLLTRYDLITHPQIDLTLEHRRFANLTLDQSQWTVESSYGAAKGRASSLQRVTSQ